jgi:uncharacterized protein involved in exopolysaccharide biosynthesis
MLRYLETFYRHRLVLTTPVALVLLLTVGWVLAQPVTYFSTVRLWVEKPTLISNPNDNPYITPAQEQSSVLTELINTKYFCLEVAKRSPLVRTVATGTGANPSLTERIMARLGRNSSKGPLSGKALDDAVFGVLSGQTIVYAAGPQVMLVNFRGNNPEFTAVVAQAIADEFIAEAPGGQRVQADAAVDFYSGQLKQTQAEVGAADTAVDEYLAAHPEQRSASAVADAKMAQLKRDDAAARKRYDDLQSKLDESKMNRAALSQAGVSGLRMLDRAELGTRAGSVKSLALVAGALGVGLGLAILIVGVIVLTLVDSTLRRPEEVEQVLDLQPVGAVPRLR